MPERWHKARIRAEVQVKGKTLTELARECGLSEAACRNALVRRHLQGEQAIAELIGVPLWELWPGRWRQGVDGTATRIDNRFRKNPTALCRPRHRQKEVRP